LGLISRGDTPGKAADQDDAIRRSKDRAVENQEAAEEKSGAGEGNRTLVFVGTGQIIESSRKNERFSRLLGTDG
jgi:hypothetical protein